MVVQQSEIRYRTIFQCIQDAIFLMDENLFVDCNDATLRIFGCRREQIIGQSPVRFSPAFQPDGEESSQKAMRKIQAALGDSPQRFEWRHCRYDGTEFDAEVSLDRFEEGDKVMLLAVIRDISESKQARQQLADAEAKYRSLVEHTSDWVWEVDAEGRYTYCSPKVKEVLGYEPHEMLGKTPFDFMAPEDIVRVNAVFLDCVRNHERIITLRNAAFRKDGVKIILETSGEPVIAGTKLLGYRGIDRDVTEREAAAEALRTREEQLLMLVKHAPAAIAMLDTDMRYLAVSDRFLKDYRLETRDITGLCHYDVFPEIRKMKHWIEIHRRCLAGAVERCEEDSFLRSDNTEDWVKWEIVPWRKPEGAIGGIVMFTEVVTDQKKAQLVLQQKNEELSNFFSVALDLLCIADLKGRFRRLNAAWQRTLGYSQEELLASRFLDLVHPDDLAETLKFMSLLASQREVTNLVNRFRCKDGSYRWLEWRSARAGDLIYAAARDITERLHAEEQLKALNLSLELHVAERTAQLRVLAERLVQTEQRERRRVTKILHEHFQQLIVGAKMHLGTLKNDPDDFKFRNTVDLIDQILIQAVEVSRALATELGPPVLHGLGLIPALHWLARRIKEKHGLEVDVYADTKGEPDSDDVKALLFEIVSELLLNVVKHAQVKSASVRISVDEGQMELVVSDAGVGFDPAELNRLKFSGLGLFSAAERIEWLGGRLKIDSMPNQGTRIFVRLPVTMRVGQ